MDQHIKAARRQLAGVCVKNLKNNGFAADYFETVPEALAFLQELIPAGASVGFGGSETLKETGILDWLTGCGNFTVPNLFKGCSQLGEVRRGKAPPWQGAQRPHFPPA